MRILLALLVGMTLAGCDVEQTTTTIQAPDPTPLPAVTRTGRPQTLADFRAVVARIEPVAERACRDAGSQLNCDFLVSVDTRDGLAPNAFQSYEPNGQPKITFTASLIRKLQNHDELAFVFGHEAAHHIAGHLAQTNNSARAGAVFGAIIGAAVGMDASGVDLATNIGGTVGARRYSKAFELEADSLGAQIVERAGYDAKRGVLYFAEAPDPGDRFLGTHPPNADRIRIVNQTIQ